ncbi:MAG: hypothetical protein NZL91_09630 [Thermoflexales bacterium]|nr:hypothetical protein [Thermoflexales bacterium]MCX7938416.1 hypothetical protein [Thermoflexales bacterium]MDW8292906.1 hypothetical protein [Anaerolineae bacterium]
MLKRRKSRSRISIRIGGDATGANITAVGGSLHIHSKTSRADEAATSEPRSELQRQLYDALRKRFSLAEIENLCFELGIAFDDLGATRRDSAARALVQVAARRGLERKLAELVARERPGAIKLQ